MSQQQCRSVQHCILAAAILPLSAGHLKAPARAPAAAAVAAGDYMLGALTVAEEDWADTAQDLLLCRRNFLG